MNEIAALLTHVLLTPAGESDDMLLYGGARDLPAVSLLSHACAAVFLVLADSLTAAV